MKNDKQNDLVTRLLTPAELTLVGGGYDSFNRMGPVGGGGGSGGGSGENEEIFEDSFED